MEEKSYRLNPCYNGIKMKGPFPFKLKELVES